MSVGRKLPKPLWRYSQVGIVGTVTPSEGTLVTSSFSCLANAFYLSFIVEGIIDHAAEGKSTYWGFLLLAASLYMLGEPLMTNG